MVRPPRFEPFPVTQIRNEKSDNRSPPTIKDNGLTEFREFLRIDLTQATRTIKTHHMLVRKFFRETGKPPSDITEQDIRGYLSKLRGTRKAKTYNNMLGSLKRYFRDFLKRLRLLSHSSLSRSSMVWLRFQPLRSYGSSSLLWKLTGIGPCSYSMPQLA